MFIYEIYMFNIIIKGSFFQKKKYIFDDDELKLIQVIEY